MNIKEKLIPVSSVACVVLYPCLFMYFQNAGEAKFTDILGVSCAFLLGAAVLFGIMLLFLRQWSNAAMVTSVAAIFFLNFATIETGLTAVFPQLYYWHFALLTLLIVVLTAVFVRYRLPYAITGLICNVILAVFGALILINAVTAIPSIWMKLSLNNAQQHEKTLVHNSASARDMPNVYYFIFDEYGGPSNLKRYCSYDNQRFYDMLTDLDFNVSLTSRNEDIESVTVIPNLLNLDYVNHSWDGTVATKKERLKEPFLFELMLSHGYTLNTLDTNDTMLDASQASFQLNGQGGSVEDSAAYYILQQTAYYPFYRDDSSADLNKLNLMLDYGATSYQLQESGLFTVGYFSCPHVPWFVDENGQVLSGLDRYNYYDPNIYLGQLKYLNGGIKAMVESIINHDHNSIIILQSDHGFRLPNAFPEQYDMAQEMNYMQNTLNAVYYQGNQLNIEAETGLNTIRLILNRLLGLQLPPIDQADYHAAKDDPT